MNNTLSHKEKIQQANDSTLTSKNQATNSSEEAQNSDVIVGENETREEAEQRIANDLAAEKPADELMKKEIRDRKRA